MHELGICDAMLKMVRGVMKDEGLEGINKITVEVGNLSGVVPRFMEECWVAVVDGTELEGTVLVAEEVIGRAKCLECEAEFDADLNNLKCPECGSDMLTPLSGRDLTIKEIEAY